MRYHNITTADMMNGEGLRVVLWLSGCTHCCHKCQNPITWNENDGLVFDVSAKQEIFEELEKDYITGITFSGGDPLHENNLDEVLKLINEIRISFPLKDVWLYSGYTFEQVMYPVVTDDFNPVRDEMINKRRTIVEQCDVFVDGRYVDAQRDVTAKWRGSTNQMVIDVKKSLEQNKVVLYCD